MKINNKKRKIKRYQECMITTFYADDVACRITTGDRDRLERQKINCLKRKHGIPQRYGLLTFANEAGEVTGYQRIAKEKMKFKTARVFESENYRYPRIITLVLVEPAKCIKLRKAFYRDIWGMKVKL